MMLLSDVAYRYKSKARRGFTSDESELKLTFHAESNSIWKRVHYLLDF
jgi:hypothetical protein